MILFTTIVTEHNLKSDRLLSLQSQGVTQYFGHIEFCFFMASNVLRVFFFALVSFANLTFNQIITTQNF